MPFLQIRQYFAKPSTSVLVPAFEAESFICKTLDSIKNQTFEDFKVLISVDKSDDDTASVVKRWCKENKISTQILIQKNRLGWVKNINFLLRKCQTKYFMVMPHDDLLEKTYIQKMIQSLKSNPNACVAYSDLQTFGDKKITVTQPSIRGNQTKRTLEFLNNHYSAVALRGLVNREIISDNILLHENDSSNFAIDTLWNLQMTLMGELIRVPEILYHKYLYSGSAHSSWKKWRKEDKINAWLEHCKDCLKIIISVGFEQKELIPLIEATKSRIFQKTTPFYAYEEISSLDNNERAKLLENLEQTIVTLGKSKNYSISQLLGKEYL